MRGPLSIDANRVAAMHRGRWYRTLPADVGQEVDQAVTLRRHRAGSALFNTGDANSGIHCVLDGYVHVTGFTHSGIEALVIILYPGDWAGFLANLDGGPYALSAVCATDCDVATVSPCGVDEIFKRDVDRFRLLVQPELIVGRRNYRYLLEYHGGPPLQRLAYRLLDLARGPQGLLDDEPAHVVCISQEQLGSAAQLSRQKVNELLHLFAAHGLMKVSRNAIEIIDSPALIKIAAGGQLSPE